MSVGLNWWEQKSQISNNRQSSSFFVRCATQCLRRDTNRRASPSWLWRFCRRTKRNVRGEGGGLVWCSLQVCYVFTIRKHQLWTPESSGTLTEELCNRGSETLQQKVYVLWKSINLKWKDLNPFTSHFLIVLVFVLFLFYLAFLHSSFIPVSC